MILARENGVLGLDEEELEGDHVQFVAWNLEVFDLEVNRIAIVKSEALESEIEVEPTIDSFAGGD